LESFSDHSEDSDSLDSTSSRKRRRVAPVDSDGEEEAPLSTVAVPSRIKSSKPASAAAKATPLPILAPVDQNTTFDSLGLKPWLVNSLTSMAIRRPTGIQKGCIPEILNGRDCIGGSRTGSGKTVAFTAPMLQKWAEDPVGIYGLILTPTRFVSSLLTSWLNTNRTGNLPFRFTNKSRRYRRPNR
jgi:ATP-dependent RNA helicase DDX49/DBP8